MEESVNVQQGEIVVAGGLANGSRRNLIQKLGGAAAAGLLAAGIRPVVGTRTAAAEALPAAVVEWVAGWESLDAERNAAPYAEDAILVAVPTGETLRGREAILANMEGLFAAFGDASARMPSVL